MIIKNQKYSVEKKCKKEEIELFDVMVIVVI